MTSGMIFIYTSVCAVVQLNAAAAALSQGDRHAWNNLVVLALMDGDEETAITYFQKFASQTLRLVRENMKLIKQ